MDKLPIEQVAKLEGNAYLEQIKVLKLAEDAKKQYYALERLTYYMEKAFAPPFHRTGRRKCSNLILIGFYIFLKRVFATFQYAIHDTLNLLKASSELNPIKK